MVGLSALELLPLLLVAAGNGAVNHYGGEGNIAEDVERASCHSGLVVCRAVTAQTEANVAKTSPEVYHRGPAFSRVGLSSARSEGNLEFSE